MNKRIKQILIHPVFLDSLEQLKQTEANRKFCGHGLPHLLDVARIGSLLIHQQELPIPLDWMYAAALLHDIGKYKQYQEGIPHETASAAMAPAILQDCGYGPAETETIIKAIRMHRRLDGQAPGTLEYLLYQADKASRLCFQCAAQAECGWSEEKKNKTIIY